MIKKYGGVFGRNPTFNDVTVEGDLSLEGSLIINGNIITGLDYNGAWDADTNSPDLTALTPQAGAFWIVSVAGTTDLDGFTSWSVGDWAIYDGSSWQRVEGGSVDLTTGVTGILPIANGGTNASDAPTARTNLGSGAVGDNLFTAVTAADAQQAMDTEVGVDVQAYDAGLQSISGLTTAADKMIYTTASDTYAVTDLTAAGRALIDDVDAAAQRTTLGVGTGDSPTFAGASLDGAVTINESGADVDFRIESDTNENAFFLDGATGNVGIGTSSPSTLLHVAGGDFFVSRGSSTTALTRSITIGGARGATGNAYALLNFRNYDNSSSAVDYTGASISAEVQGTSADGGELIFSTSASTADPTERMRIDSSGNVGIGTSSPASELDVNGTVTADNVTATEITTSRLNVGANLAWNSSTDTYTANTTPSSVTKIHQGMKRCLLNMDGSVNYYLNPSDSTQKLDGTSATLDGTDGYVMVEIPKFYFRYVLNGSTHSWEISDLPLAGYQLHPAFFKDGEIVDYRYISAYDACLKFERSITAVADAGGGDITVTTSAQHPLYAGDTVTISGTTSYDGDYTVVTRASGTTFTVTATFVATETGTATGYVSGKNLDDMTSNIDTSNDALAVISSQYPLVGVTRDECRSLAANVGTGWRQQDFWLISAIQLLYLVEYGTFYNQNELGAGNTGVASYPASSSSQTDSPHSVAGKSNSLGNASTDTTSGASSGTRDTAYMSYRGIENFFGNCWNWVDGINIGVGANYNVHVSNTTTHFADNTSTNYDLIGQCASANGYVQNISDVPGAFIPNDTTGASSTSYLTDYFYINTGNRVARFGGAADLGADAGAFYWLWSDASSGAARNRGARLAF